MSRPGPSLVNRAVRRLERDLSKIKYFASFYFAGFERDWLRRAEAGFSARSGGVLPEVSAKNLARAVSAYRLAKTKQDEGISEPYRIGPLWQEIVEDHFGGLLGLLEADDDVGLRRMLGNFQRERCARWTGGSYDDWELWNGSWFYRFEFVQTWLQHRGFVEDQIGSDRKLVFPAVGNPAGMQCDGSIIPLESLRYRYYADEMHSLLRDIEDPVICEIGGGLGGQAWCAATTSTRPLKYLIYDLPELLFVAGVFLLEALPDHRVVLFGEEETSGTSQSGCEIHLRPNFEMPTLPDQSVDLFFNSCSLSEMNSEASAEYINQIERLCRRYFLHSNHTARFEWDTPAGTIRNITADRLIPDPRLFKRIYSHPRVFSTVSSRRFLRLNDARHLVALFERLNTERLNT